MPSLDILDAIDFPAHGKLNDLVRVYFVELYKISKAKARAQMTLALQRVDTFEQWVLEHILGLYGLGLHMGLAVCNTIDFVSVRVEIEDWLRDDMELSDDESEVECVSSKA